MYPEVGIPGKRKSTVLHKYTPPKNEVVAQGHIKVSDLPICLVGEKEKGSLLSANACSVLSTDWVYTKTGDGPSMIGFGSCKTFLAQAA